MSQKLMARLLWSQPRTVGNNNQGLLTIIHCEKEQNVAGAGAKGQHFSRANILVLASGDKYSTRAEVRLRGGHGPH